MGDFGRGGGRGVKDAHKVLSTCIWKVNTSEIKSIERKDMKERRL